MHYICIAMVCLVPMEVRNGYQILWNRSHGWLCATMCLLGSEPWFSARLTRALKDCAITHTETTLLHVCFVLFSVWKVS